MDKTKIIPIIFLIVVLSIGFVAFTFYGEKQSLAKKNEKIKEESAVLIEENNNLRYRYNKIEKENSDLERKMSTIGKELSSREDAIEDLRRKWQDTSRERDALVERLKKPTRTTEVSVMPTMSADIAQTPEEHWAKFVKEKASLEVTLNVLNRELLDTKNEVAELDKDNKELSIKIDQLSKDKERLAQDMKFKERILRVMSMDLVREREERGAAVTELNKLRGENVGLKRELILANKEKINMRNNLKKAIEKKEALADKIMDAENILKEKFFALESLERDLKEAVSGGKRIIAGDSASIELPPIIVRPETSGIKGLRGEVIAINLEEKFVVVNVGEASGIRPGVLLKIIRANKEIAEVEVIETRKEISAADIKTVIAGFTIQEGDSVVSR